MTTLTADAQGVITGKFTIPANVLAGAKAVLAEGMGGSKASATFTGRGTITTEERRRVNTISTVSWFASNKDPLAQTFTLAEGRHVAGVDLWFTAKGDADVIVQIRDTQTGFPAQNILAAKRVKTTDMTAAPGSTRVQFDTPVWLDAGREFAIVIMTNSALAAVAVAELGKFDSSLQKWVTGQPYQVGVLLSSSNASTWTAHQDRDLAFRLLGCKFTSTTRTIALDDANVAAASDLLAEMSIDIPATGTVAELVATDPAGNTYRMQPDAPVSLASRITGNMHLAINLTGTDKASPVVYPGLQFVAGSQVDTGTYVSRAFPCGTSARVAVTFEAYAPGTSSILVEIQKADGSWQAVALSSGTDVGDGWVERNHIVTGFTATNTRVRLTLNGSAAYRPQVRKLRAVATD